jgi:eukaryotic-like serine/threonine-protein kinase
MAAAAKSPDIPARYTLKVAAGKGSFGGVDIYTDKFLSRDVAIKTVIAGGGTKAHDQLENEILRLSTVRSKHVVELYDVIWDVSGKVAGMIMEYIPGNTLSDFYSKGFDAQKYLRALYQIARGLADIHEADLVHRDIKLENMKASAEGLVKLFDFGLTSEEGAVTTASMGTHVYRAPEMYSPPVAITKQLDTYAFGACCWTLALGLPNAPKVLGEIPPQHSASCPSVKTFFSTLDTDVCQLLDSCLSVDRAKRPSMSDVAQALENELLCDQHSALLIYKGTPTEIHAKAREAKLEWKGVASGLLKYDGLRFVLTKVTGEFYINNMLITGDVVVKGACVITLGNPSRGAQRDFIEFDISHPEVVL